MNFLCFIYNYLTHNKIKIFIFFIKNVVFIKNCCIFASLTTNTNNKNKAIMKTIEEISKKIQKELKKVIGIEVFVEFVNAAKPYVFLEWQGNEEEVNSKINTYFENKCTDFSYDEDFNFSSCAIYL